MSFGQVLREPSGQLFNAGGLALPHHEHTPTRPPQLAKTRYIPLRISQQLRLPPLPSRRGNGASSAGVHVPEAAAHLDDLAMSHQHDVRRPRQRAVMQAIAIAEPVNDPPDKHFGLDSSATLSDSNQASVTVVRKGISMLIRDNSKIVNCDFHDVLID